MSKKLWKFCITYKIKGLEKRWFNRYKKIEETDIELILKQYNVI